MEAAASVLPEPVPPPTFKKPVPMTPPLTAFDPGFLARKAALPGKVFRLKNGNALEYFEEGSAGDPVVACFAAGGFNVSSLWTKEPVPGVRMLWVKASDQCHRVALPNNSRGGASKVPRP